MRFFSNLEALILKERSIRFEAWQAALIGLILLLCTIAFGALVKHGSENYARSGLLSKASFKLASLPSDTMRVFSLMAEDYNPELAWEQRFTGQTGFVFSQMPNTEGDLLLLSRYDGDADRTSVEIIDLESGDVIHSYKPNPANILQHLEDLEESLDDLDPRLNLNAEFLPGGFGMYHPLVAPDASLVFQNFYSPIVKIDACSNLEWAQHGAYHHAIETDSDGNIWTTTLSSPPTLENVATRFYDDTLVSISPDGEVLFRKPLSQILLDNGFDHLVFPHFPHSNDPFHLNDIQPVMQDGPHWKKGDLFLSVRNASRIIQYRPSTNEIVWMKHGPWMLQHDVDIINDHQISVFNNNVATGRFKYPDSVNDTLILGPEREMFVRDTNETLVYDFQTDEVSSPYKAGYEKHDIRTVIQGLHEVLPNGDVFVEEAKYGRLLVMSPDGEIRWSYVNRADSGAVFSMHWSRYLSGDLAQSLRETIATGIDCQD